jgi:alkylation response protein AidB-like acyl-CoA dehydrogenase
VAFENAARTECGALPLPGAGHTERRFEALARWSASDLSVGRLVEGHADALAILAEAGRRPADPAATYGVWAARSRTGGTTARLEADGWHLAGQKAFCSGSGFLDRALLTADTPDGYRLFDIAVANHVASTLRDSWPAVGMADSLSETLEFAGPAIGRDAEVGGPGFYLERPGFWFGAIGVAACWYGGAAGLVRHLADSLDDATSELVVAELGHAVAHVGAMRRILQHSAREIDADPRDVEGGGMARALVVRHAVRHGATEVLSLVASAGGARALSLDRAQSRRAADLYVYLAQHHGPQDAVQLGRMAMEGGTP